MKNLIKEINSISKIIKKDGNTISEIREAEKQLGVKFSKDFITYLENFGIITFYGTEWNGIKCSKYRDVVETTIEERKNDLFSKNMYVIEDLHIDSIKILSDEKGLIYSWDGKKCIEIHKSLVEYLEACLKRKNSM